MGHERAGALPKTRVWRAIIQQIGAWSDGGVEASQIARATIVRVRKQFRGLSEDTGVQAAFAYLVALATAMRDAAPDDLRNLGLPVGQPPTPLQVAVAIRRHVGPATASLEYGGIAEAAAMDAVSTWFRAADSPQLALFELEPDPWRRWQSASSAAGFCELSRLFFARLTERYLRYFLDREASASLPTLADRKRFDDALAEHVEDISQHAFETSKITQSFAAGWYQNHTHTGVPSRTEISGFLRIAFGKLRDELLREEGAA